MCKLSFLISDFKTVRSARQRKHQGTKNVSEQCQWLFLFLGCWWIFLSSWLLRSQSWKRNEVEWVGTLAAIIACIHFLLFLLFYLVAFECFAPTDRGVFRVMFTVRLDWEDNIEKNGKLSPISYSLFKSNASSVSNILRDYRKPIFFLHYYLLTFTRGQTCVKRRKKYY